MTSKYQNSLWANDRGQMFVGYIIALMLITLVPIWVMQQVRRLRVNTDRRVYQDQALAIARQGFEEGLSYFQRQPNGVYLDQGLEKPANQNWITPWPIYPDAAFLPQATDTDHASMIAFAANVAMTSSAGVTFAQRAGEEAIIRTFPLFVDPSLTTTAKPFSYSPVWGSYVIRRQNARNWSPGPNTYSAFSDPEAAHDLTSQQSQDPPGEGDYWSMVSHGYVFTNPNNVTVSAGFEDTTMYEGNSILNAPRRFYHNKPFLLASARVYGELNRINFKDQNAAVWVDNRSTMVLNQKSFINGGTENYGVAYLTGAAPTTNNGTIDGLSQFNPCGLAPSIQTIFPGFTKASLQRRASPNCYGTIGIFPAADSTTLTATASQNLFYYETGNATFLQGTSVNVMTGVGLVIIDGNLTFNAGNPSTWNGIVVVLGDCIIHGPAIIQGTLVVTGNLTMGNASDNNNAEVDYNPDAIASVTSFLQNFKVDKQSMIATFN